MHEIGREWLTHRNEMGIRGLHGYLKWKIPSIKQKLQWEKYSGHTWGIDCSCILYRARSANLSPITVLASILVRMRMANITPIVIFDGKPPVIKSDVIEQRRADRQAVQKEIDILQQKEKEEHLTMSDMDHVLLEKKITALQSKTPHISHGDKDHIKQFLYTAGILFVTAMGEADDLLAYLVRTRQIHAIVSTDMDMLARGTSLLVIPETNDASVINTITLQHLLNGLRLTFEQFVYACMLMGSDYSGKKWKPVDPPSAVDIARKTFTTFTDISGSPLYEGICRLHGVDVTWEQLLSESQQKKWTSGPSEKEPDALKDICSANKWPVSWLSTLLS
jgi:hypothetical protein